ncbi:MAG: glycosyltransferase family 4 protein [Deltaproteobacteria bacterium]|nr:glycosyltransferase family 4 protein [Deltaproteobacteria bacterium]
MRVAIGAVLGTLGGPATYARELVHALAASEADTEFIVITDAPQAIRQARRNLTVVKAPLPGPFALPLWDHVVVPLLARRHRPDVYHGTKGVLPRRLGCQQVVSIHDLAVYHFPETFARPQRWQQRWELPWAVRRAARVIADSQHARRDIVAHFGLDPGRVVAIPLGASPVFGAQPAADESAIVARLRLPSRFLLYAGTIQPRKNIELLVEAFSGWAGAADWQLLIAGRRRPTYRPEMIDHPPPRVRLLGAVSDTELAVLYRHARALISPSAYEGFGLSLLEAMSCGCVVVAGANSAAVELVSGAGMLLDRLDVTAIRATLDILAADQQRCEQLRAAGLARSADFSWPRTASATMAVYRAVAAEGR